MSVESRKWIPVVSGAKEAESSIKEVISSGYVDVRKAALDQGAVGKTRVKYQARGMWQDTLSYEGADFDTLKAPSAGRMQVPGAPEIPQEGLFVAVPANAEVKGVQVISKKERELSGKFTILPASKPVIEGVKPEHIPDPQIYDSDEPFPGKYVELLGEKHVAGRKVAHILVYLAQFRPKSKKVTALQSIELEVTYETHPGMDAEPRRRLLRRSPLEDLILDSESIVDGEKARLDEASAYDVGPMDTGLKNQTNCGEYLIITTNALQKSVSPLASAKGVNHSVMVVTREDIVAEFPRTSVQLSILEFLRYAYDYWYEAPEWVVLAGDVDQIPTNLTTYVTPDPDVPADLASDHYYADLYGDLSPELAVGRLPVSNAEDMYNLCRLAVAYNKQTGSWRKKVLLTAYQRTEPSDDYIDCKNNIATTAGTEFTVTKKYAGHATKQQVKDEINDGAVIVNYRGHGSDTAWSASNGLTAADVRGLSNAGKLPLVFSIACWNAHIDMAGECFGETWIREEKTPCFLGATRPSFTYPNHDFDEYLFDAIVNEQLIMVGDIINWAKTKLLLNYSPANLAQDNVRMYLLLGDPTLSVYFVGNQNTGELHIADCQWVGKMRWSNKRYFRTVQDAIDMGYNGCYYCLREYNTG